MCQKVIYFSNIVSFFRGGGGDSVPNDLVLNDQEDI